MSIIFPPPHIKFPYLSRLSQSKEGQKKLRKSKGSPSSKSYRFTLSLPLQIPKYLLTLAPPSPLSITTDLFSCRRKYFILPKSRHLPLRTQKSSSMQPRRSRFTELIDVPFATTTGSSSSDLSLDDVLRETEQLLLSQNRAMSFWNGWDHLGSGLQRRHSRPKSRLRKKRIGDIPRNVFGPSKGQWF